MFDIGFFELMVIMAIAVVVIGPQNLPKLAKAIGKGWGEFQGTFNSLKQEVMDEAEGLKQTVNIENLEQDVAAATKVDVDVNLDLNETIDIVKDIRNSTTNN
jgi:sec-independent protein translocase protein TatB